MFTAKVHIAHEAPLHWQHPHLQSPLRTPSGPPCAIIMTMITLGQLIRSDRAVDRVRARRNGPSNRSTVDPPRELDSDPKGANSVDETLPTDPFADCNEIAEDELETCCTRHIEPRASLHEAISERSSKRGETGELIAGARPTRERKVSNRGGVAVRTAGRRPSLHDDPCEGPQEAESGLTSQMEEHGDASRRPGARTWVRRLVGVIGVKGTVRNRLQRDRRRSRDGFEEILNEDEVAAKMAACVPRGMA